VLSKDYVQSCRIPLFFRKLAADDTF
jgi:hypothetical protein